MRRASLAILAIALFAPTPARADEPVFGLDVAVALGEDGKPVRDRAWVLAQIAEAEKLFSAAPVHVLLARWRTLAAEHAKLVTPADRDALAARVEAGGRVPVFVVASLRDIDVREEAYRMGVTWTSRGKVRGRYVIVASSARPTVLAHELGHFFGLQHSAVKNDLMSYDRDGAAVFLEPAQLRSIRWTAGALVGARTLVPLAQAVDGAGPLPGIVSAK
jgi:hypothetical protein